MLDTSYEIQRILESLCNLSDSKIHGILKRAVDEIHSSVVDDLPTPNLEEEALARCMPRR